MSYVIHLQANFNPGFEAAVEVLKSKLAQKFYDTLLNNIRSNKYGFANRIETVQRKKLAGHGPTPMIDTGDYINSIKVEGGRVYLEGATKRGLDFGELGNILEYGRRDRAFEGYPVWRKTLEELTPEFKKDISTFIKQNLFTNK